MHEENKFDVLGSLETLIKEYGVGISFDRQDVYFSMHKMIHPDNQSGYCYTWSCVCDSLEQCVSNAMVEKVRMDLAYFKKS